MAQQQSSRLNRLLTLLDTGSTLATRRTAAKQIGEIAKARPEDLYALLKKVCPFIHSKNWDTRVAAATAVGAIAENSNHASVKDLIVHAQRCLSELGYNFDLNTILASNWITQESSSKGLSFRSFDIKKVMDYGALLLSSGGQEYDVGVDDKTPADRLARQKQMLSRRLGLDVCEQFMDINDMIRDDDIMQRGMGSENGHGMYGGVYHSTEGKQRVQQLVANMVPTNFPRRLSARERNLLKRKAKESMKEASKGWGDDDEIDEPSSKRTKSIKPILVDQPSGDKIMMEAVLDEDIVAQSGEGCWPFGPFVEQLMHDMFDPVWEIRHGSIMALREILSIQASSAAVQAVDLNLDCGVDSHKKIGSVNDSEHQKAVTQMVDDHQLVVSKVVDDHQKLMSELVDDHQEIVSEMLISSETVDDQQKGVSEIDDVHQKVSSEMVDDHSKVLSLMLDDHDKLSSEMVDDHPKVLSPMLDDHEKVDSEMVHDHQEVLSKTLDDHQCAEMNDNHPNVEVVDHQKVEMVDDHQKVDMVDEHQNVDMVDDHQSAEMNDNHLNVELVDHQKVEMVDDHQKVDMVDEHQNVDIVDEHRNIDMMDEHQNVDMVDDHCKDEMVDHQKVASAMEGEEKIDLNIGLFSEECSEVKLDYSLGTKAIKLEQECLDSVEAGSLGNMRVKPKIDLNEEVKPSIFIDEGTEMSTNQLVEEKVARSSMGILSGLPEGSKAVKIYKTVERAWASNTDFLQDCAIRFLCIFSLDRFGDYVSDQVVAPVRETCAQVLGAVLKQMHPYLVHETLSILLQMQGRPEWEVRHGSLLGIKYLVAVRQEMLPELLPRVLPACINGLEDRDDDVRAVAAEAMTPAAAAIVASGENSVNTILLLLWDILLDLDDLSPSTSSVMHLLAEIYTQKDIARELSVGIADARPMFDLNEAIQLDDDSEDEIKHMDDPSLLSTLTPRLWPFMRHNISSVRHAAISTLERILESGKKSEAGLSWVVPIVGDALRLIYQNLLLESDVSIVECSKRVWRLLLQIPKEDLASAAEKFFSSWLRLASTATGSPLEASKMFSPTTLPRRSHVRAAAKLRASKGESSASAYDSHHQNTEARNSDSSFSGVGKVIVGSDTEKSVVQMRVSTAFALGVMASSLPPTLHNMLVEVLSSYLSSTSGVQRQVACMVLAAWFRELRKSASDAEFSQAVRDAKTLHMQLIRLLSFRDPSAPNPDSQLPYAELARTYSKMRNEAGSLMKQAESAGVYLKGHILPLEKIGAENAIDIAMKIAAESLSLHAAVDDKQSLGLDFIESMRQRLLATAGYLKLLQGNLHVSVMASVAGAVVWMGELPVKLNPVIQPLMAAIKREQEDILQQMAADALAETMSQCVGRKPSPNEKLIYNICTLTCADPIETPQATPANATSINLDDIEALKTSGLRQRLPIVSTAEERSRMEGAITKRGAECALKFLCAKFEGSLFEKLPKLWDCLTEALKLSASSNGAQEIELSSYSGTIIQHGEPQALINNMQVICSITPVLDRSLETQLIMLLPAIFGCVRHVHAAVRLMAAKCITAMAKAWREPLMASVLENGAPMLDDALSVEARQGASMLLMLLVEGLQADLVPYAPFLIVPLLGCMSDTDSIVRQSVTHSFAALVPLLPLAKGVTTPPGLNESLLSRSTEDARFLEQLLDNSRVDDYHLAVELKTSLRRYQQEGINWLGFLKRFKLHGILCDDMGLGKTLQASAIVASDIAERQESHMSTSNAKLLPSLIICPSTLVGHWVFEIEKFIQASIINPLQYVGTPQDRLQLQSQIDTHNLIVTSYDVLRKDVEFLSKFVWNFCILDEGHIIKNSKSKLTLAVKQLRAEHRLILSGTPIQNNVLELWSLFDFLMPGFLGTERQFQHMYGKPILAARDAKCSAKEAEAGALAMEALHKQVMPFLLRRTKDDVLADLPPKIIQDRYCDLSPLQLRLYERFSHSQVKSEVANLVRETAISDIVEEPSSRQPTHVFQALQYLRKLCSHPLLVLDEKYQDQLDSIELETGKDGKINLHELHHSPKLLALKEILEECGIGTQSGSGDSPTFNEGGQHRVLIFAQLKNFLDIIEKDLFQTHMKGVTYLRLDGSIEPDKRFDVVKAFNSDPTIDVLLLTTHVGGLGLNLTTADTVVFMEHDWNPMRDLQAMDRAHRLGQKRVVNVHRLVMRGTLEEKVMSLQRFKLSVANTVVNAENASLDKMDTGQLLDLFSVSGAGKSQSKAKHGKDEDHAIATSTTTGAGKGLKAMLSGLEELWDQSQYSEEYNLDQFVSRLNG